MTTKSFDETNGCTLQWKIENITHCWVRFGYKIDSPMFIADALKGTKWFLQLFPSGGTDRNYISLLLHRVVDCEGPKSLETNYQLAIMGKDGSILKETTETKHNFEKNRWHGSWNFEKREKVFVTEREAFLPDDTLTVQCTIWDTYVKPVNPQHLYARTVFEVKRRNFMWKLDKYSSLQSGWKNKFKDSLIEFGLVLKGLDLEKKLAININSFDESIKYFSINISTVDSQGIKEICGTQEYYAVDLKKGELCTLLFSKKLMENKVRYLPNDVLTLDCECAYSCGNVSFEQWGYGVVSPKIKNEIGAENNTGKGNLQITPALANDLKSMYNDKILSDTELRTTSQTFQAHKNILSARSPVFRKMFSYDMKEKISGHVEITDLEDDTVHRLLLYIYTDTFDDLQFESACKLYVAADKYEIMSLRSRCSLFLKDHLCPAKACDVLMLADRHQDDDLKNSVEDFILKNDKEVFGSLQWRDFIEANSKLAADVMYQFTLSKLYEP